MKIIHLVGNNNIGGVRRGIETMLNSPLSSVFEFSVNYNNTVDITNPDIIIWHDAVSTKNLFKLLQIKLTYRHSKLIIHEHHYSEYFEKFNPPPSPFRFHSVVRLCFALADKVVANSNANAAWMFEHNLVSRDKVTVIQSYNSSIEDLLSLPVNEVGEDIIFGCYGRGSLQKGIDILLYAIPLVKSHNVKFHVQILSEELEEYYKRSNLNQDPRVQVFSKLDDLYSYLHSCNVIVIPSRWESFGQVCLEAKAAGKLVLASAVDGLVEQVKDADCGFLVEPNNPSKLASLIDDIALMKPDLIKHLGLNGRRSLVKDANVYVYYKAWLDILAAM